MGIYLLFLCGDGPRFFDDFNASVLVSTDLSGQQISWRVFALYSCSIVSLSSKVSVEVVQFAYFSQLRTVLGSSSAPKMISLAGCWAAVAYVLISAWTFVIQLSQSRPCKGPAATGAVPKLRPVSEIAFLGSHESFEIFELCMLCR